MSFSRDITDHCCVVTGWDCSVAPSVFLAQLRLVILCCQSVPWPRYCHWAVTPQRFIHWGDPTQPNLQSAQKYKPTKRKHTDTSGSYSSTQPSIPPGSVNEYQLRKAKAGMVHSVSG